MKETTLYQLNDGNTRATIKLIDLGDQIKVDGYDVGQAVKNFWGASDYEYALTIAKTELSKIGGNAQDPFAVFEAFINDPKCFSKIRKLFDDNGVVYDHFSWRSGG